ncbi:MAG: hypothetical protein QG635_2057, partial [Bacteroidota bacterium]|nr:hypothetical protein [Bacteroidota bacterium]
MKLLSIIFILASSLYLLNSCVENTSEVSIAAEVSQISTTFTANLHSVAFANSNVGYAVGDSGSIIKTTDGGDTWFNLFSGSSNGLACINVVNDNNIFVGGNDIILHSTNQGYSWEEMYIPGDGFHITINDINFINNIGWAVGGDIMLNSELSRILKSTNFGSNWSDVYFTNIKYSISSVLSIDTNSIIFSHSNEIWISQDSAIIYKSTNNGQNFNIVKNDYFGGVQKLNTFDKNKLFACSRWGRIYISNNQGDSWTSIDLPDSTKLNSIYAINNNIAFSCGYYGKIIMTDDGGSLWEELNSVTQERLTGIAAPT